MRHESSNVVIFNSVSITVVIYSHLGIKTVDVPTVI